MIKITQISKKQLVFIGFFLLFSTYYLLIKHELYESKTSLLVRDIGTSTNVDGFGLALLGMGNSSQLQDSKIVEQYLMSLDVFVLLDEKFSLSQHYKSDALDFVERLSDDATKEDVLELYNSRLVIYYDEISGILSVAFSHVEAKKSQEILEFLVDEVEKQVNEFNRRKIKKQLKFVESEYLKKKEKMEISSKTIETYQNKHLLLDPTAEATASSVMITQLEATLTQKKIELATKQAYLNHDSIELISLRSEIKEIQNSINAKRAKLSGSSDTRLNKVLFEFEKLKRQLEFDIEVYKNALIQLETTKLEVQKEAKTLSVVSKPNMPDGYTYPNKPKVFLTILIVTLLTYGIFSMLSSIIRDHKE